MSPQCKNESGRNNINRSFFFPIPEQALSDLRTKQDCCRHTITIKKSIFINFFIIVPINSVFDLKLKKIFNLYYKFINNCIITKLKVLMNEKQKKIYYCFS